MEDTRRLMAARLLEQMRGAQLAGGSGAPGERERSLAAPAGKQWHFLPSVFVLIRPSHLQPPPASCPAATALPHLPPPLVYTMKEQQGFYDLGMGYTSPAYVHSLVLFQEACDAERYAGLLEAGGFPALSVHEVHPRVAFVFSVKKGMRICVVPPDTLLIPPSDDAQGNSNGHQAAAAAWSALDAPWVPDGKEVFDRSLLASMGFGDSVDYEDERRRLEAIFARDE